MSALLSPHDQFCSQLAATVPAPDPARGFVSFDRVASREVQWLWPGWIPAGRVTVLDGDPDLGKSTVLLDLAARLSAGREFPDGAKVEAASVILLAAEDDLEETLRPRLEAAGANLARCHCLESVLDEGKMRPPRLPGDLPALEQRVIETGTRLLVVDPFHAFLGEETDSYREQSVRACLEQLTQLCRRRRLACVLVRHLTKRAADRAIYRGGGSMGIIAVARAGLLLAPEPDNEQGRVLAVSKTNLSKTPTSLRLQLETVGNRICRVIWSGTSPETADSLLGRIPGSQEKSRLQEAIDLLMDTLGGYPIAATEVQRRAATAGIAAGTLRRAKEKLAIRSVRIPYRDPPSWGWVFRDAYDKRMAHMRAQQEKVAREKAEWEEKADRLSAEWEEQQAKQRAEGGGVTGRFRSLADIAAKDRAGRKAGG